MNNQAGKGDKPRPVKKEVYNKNFEEIQGMGKMNGKPLKTIKGKTTYGY